MCSDGTSNGSIEGAIVYTGRPDEDVSQCACTLTATTDSANADTLYSMFLASFPSPSTTGNIKVGE